MPVVPRFRSLLAGLGSLLPRRSRQNATDSRVVRPWRDDSFRPHPTLGLTPSRALAALHAADAGSPQMQFDLYADMLQKWPRLAAVAATRRLALTGLDWEIVPGDTSACETSAADAPAASRTPSHDTRSDASHAAAAFCRDALRQLPRLDDVLHHLASAVGFGLAVAELVWEDGRLADIVPVPYSRLIGDPHEPWRLRVRTEDEPSLGVALDETPGKWIIHAPRAAAGRPFESGLLRASVPLFVAQNATLKDWLIYSQIAAMPLRVARHDPGMTAADRADLLRTLESLSTDAVAVFDKSVELMLLEAGRGEKPYQPLQDYCNTEVTILWLGQHLTTDVRGQASRAAAQVHDRVREDLLADDIRDESASLTRDVLTPLVRARFGAAAPGPTACVLPRAGSVRWRCAATDCGRRA